MKPSLLLAALALIPLASPALAQDTASGLTGDWNGHRQSLADQGVAFTLGYTSEDFRNVGSGGRSVGAHAGQLSLGSQLDLDKLWGVHGAELQVALTYRDGDNLQDRGVRTLLQPQEIHGRGQTWRLTGLWWGQRLLDDRLLLKLGRLTVGGEFGDVECTFVNQGLCGTEAGNIVGDYWYNWPISQWAAVAKVQFDPSHSLKLGLYQVNPALLERGHRFTLNPSGTIGALLPVEFEWDPQLGQAHLPGAYKIGAWYTNIHKQDVYTDVEGDPAAWSGLDQRMRDGAYGSYFTIEQQLTVGQQGGKRGLRAFVNATVSDRRTSIIDRTLAIGTIYAGPFASRPADEIGLGVSAVHVNARATATQDALYQQGLRDMPGDRAEYTAELFYGWQATAWLRLQPEVQWIHHPGGHAPNQDDYALLGIKTSIAF